MKLISYKSNNDSLKELANLCNKILKTKKTILIRVSNDEQCKSISEYFWKTNLFVPHGINGHDFCEIQPILLSTDSSISRDIFINFEDVHTKHYDLHFKIEAFILWNCSNYPVPERLTVQGHPSGSSYPSDFNEFEFYHQDDQGHWKKMSK